MSELSRQPDFVPPAKKQLNRFGCIIRMQAGPRIKSGVMSYWMSPTDSPLRSKSLRRPALTKKNNAARKERNVALAMFLAVVSLVDGTKAAKNHNSKKPAIDVPNRPKPRFVSRDNWLNITPPLLQPLRTCHPPPQLRRAHRSPPWPSAGGRNCPTPRSSSPASRPWNIPSPASRRSWRARRR